ncbi:MAG TPA: hypothetical protein DEP48_03150 [Persephonella sp.]|uniref:Uncharacterized protein n=1 Tax=Persephonella marina (strain DSM 14350 / EX-H1) TaxID=123214 RepID=C0QSE3_PERMH|nr:MULTISPECIES: hypothetical protein [Persephonella]ACO02984.1 hypothetical protein PERMA_1826 [Persephonella marina EX-H1]HCB69336.1 hypothetical protein [Persephonella sp.]
MSILTMLKEPDGKWSFTRVSGFILLIHYMISASYITVKTATIPDFPTNHFYLIASLYGINKLFPRFKEAVKNVAEFIKPNK